MVFYYGFMVIWVVNVLDEKDVGILNFLVLYIHENEAYAMAIHFFMIFLNYVYLE